MEPNWHVMLNANNLRLNKELKAVVCQVFHFYYEFWHQNCGIYQEKIGDTTVKISSPYSKRQQHGALLSPVQVMNYYFLVPGNNVFNRQGLQRYAQ